MIFQNSYKVILKNYKNLQKVSYKISGIAQLCLDCIIRLGVVE